MRTLTVHRDGVTGSGIKGKKKRHFFKKKYNPHLLLGVILKYTYVFFYALKKTREMVALKRILPVLGHFKNMATFFFYAFKKGLGKTVALKRILPALEAARLRRVETSRAHSTTGTSSPGWFWWSARRHPPPPSVYNTRLQIF